MALSSCYQVCFIIICLLKILYGNNVNDNVHFELWVDIVINSGLTNITFVPTPRESGFIIYSIQCPYNQILVSLFPNFTNEYSQFGNHLGLIDRRPPYNESTVLYIYSYYAKPLKAAVKAVIYAPEYAVPGGCGKSATDHFSTSTITTHSIKNSKFLFKNQINSPKVLEYWTSSLHFFPVSAPESLNESCNEVLKPDSKSLQNVIYHVYYIPLVTCGGNSETYTNPTITDVLQTLSGISSSSDTLLHAIHVNSISGADLKLNADNSCQIDFVRHIGTSSVVNLIAEYKTFNNESTGSSTFIAYTPTIMYTCSPPSDYTNDVQIESNRISCGILSDSVTGTDFFVGLVMIFSIIFTFSGSYFVWSRCVISLMLTSSLICLIFHYRYNQTPQLVSKLIFMGVLIPALVGFFIFLLIWLICLRRRKSVSESVFVPPRRSIFAYSDIPSSTSRIGCQTTGGPEGAGIINNASYYRQEHSDEPDLTNFRAKLSLPKNWPNNNESSIAYYPTTRLDTGFEETNDCIFHQPCDSRPNTHCCYYSKDENHFRFVRLARLSAIFPAVFLLSSLLNYLCLDAFDAFHRMGVYFGTFILTTLVLSMLMFIYKNFAFGVCVSVTGLYIGFSSFCLLFYPTSIFPYILIDQFLILTWPESRLQIYRLSAYGKNDVIFLVVWLLSSLVSGAINLCFVRLKDAQDHVNSKQRTINASSNQTFPRHNYTGTLVNNASTTQQQSIPSSSWRRPLFRFPFSTGRSGLRSPDQVSIIGSHNEGFSSVLDNSLLTSSAAWPPQPFNDRQLQSINERRCIVDRQRTYQVYGGVLEARPPLVPLSRAQIAAAASVGLSGHHQP